MAGSRGSRILQPSSHATPCGKDTHEGRATEQTPTPSACTALSLEQALGNLRSRHSTYSMSVPPKREA